MQVSVIICTYNPRPQYLSRALDGLRAQTLPLDQWELVVVDNRSSPPVAGRFDLSWHPNARIVREEKQGLTPARLRGLDEAGGELIVLVDDDNVLEPDYLQTAVMVARERPYLGSWSGQCLPEFESEPPAWTRRYWGALCIREFESEVWSNLPRLPDTMPDGAGLCLRREVAERYLELHRSGQRAFQLDRSGDSLVSGGDNDLAACACDVGLGVGLIPQLKLRHLISADRVSESYLKRLVEGIVVSSVVLAWLWRSDLELAAYRVKPHHRLRALMNSGPHRRMQLAVLRGRQRGLRYVAKLGAAGR